MIQFNFLGFYRGKKLVVGSLVEKIYSVEKRPKRFLYKRIGKKSIGTNSELLFGLRFAPKTVFTNTAPDCLLLLSPAMARQCLFGPTG